jgi:hypothetical protein
MNYNTNFKNNLIDNLEKKNISKTSINNYVRNLEKLNDDMPLKNINFLENIDEILEKLKDYKPNTYRSYLISICSILSLLNSLSNSKKKSKLYNQYYDKLMEINKNLKEQEKNQEKTDTQKENWISWDDVKNKYLELFEQVEKFKKSKQINNNKYNILLKFVVLSLYFLLPPKRNQDYMEMYIVNKNKNLSDDKNYLVLTDKKFIFNKFKTSKTKGEIIDNIPNELWDIIKIYLNFHPLKNEIKKKDVPFLVYADGQKFETVNSITRILNNIFNKKIGSSMLRHIYLSSKYGDITKEMKEDAEIMGHSLETQKNNYIKID